MKKELAEDLEEKLYAFDKCAFTRHGRILSS